MVSAVSIAMFPSWLYRFDFGIENELGVFWYVGLIFLLLGLISYKFLIEKRRKSSRVARYISFPLSVGVVFTLSLIVAFLNLFLYKPSFALFLSLFFIFFIYLALWDTYYLSVPSWLMISFVGLAFLGVSFLPLGGSILDGLAFSGVLACLNSIFSMFNKVVVGEGDIMFAFAFGTVLGFWEGFYALFLGCIFGVLIFLLVRYRALPLIALMFFGTLSSYFIGLVSV